ncbi:MAG: CsgG/HfaB family protein [Candidatus Hydrothermales bacterium]
MKKVVKKMKISWKIGSFLFFISSLFLHSCATQRGVGYVVHGFDVKKTYKLALIPQLHSNYLKQPDLEKVYEYYQLVLLSFPFFRIIDRKNIEVILNEQNFQYSGLVDESQAVEFGKLLAADFIGVYEVMSASKGWDDILGGQKYKISLVFKLIDVEKGEILYYGSGDGEAISSEIRPLSESEAKIEAIRDGIKNSLKKLKESYKEEAK